jgi:hypothetical protein
MALVRERIVRTNRPPLVGEVSVILIQKQTARILLLLED